MKTFLKLVEIQTKVASLLPFVYGLIYAQWKFGAFNGFKTLLFFVALLCIDMATTALNNYMDYKRDKLKKGYNFEEHNAIVRDQIPIRRVEWIVLSLLSVGALAGLSLVVYTDYFVLLIGILSFGVGILYSYGPVPISHTPFGELFSGVMMGFLIFLVTVYIQLDAPRLFVLSIQDGFFQMQVQIIFFAEIMLMSIPFVLGIAGIMLANNISDIEDDAVNLRKTLPQFIGRKGGILVLNAFYGISLIQLLALIAFKIYPIYGLSLVLLFIVIGQKLAKFNQNPCKATTFGLVVQSYILLSIGHMVILTLALFW